MTSASAEPWRPSFALRRAQLQSPACGFSLRRLYPFSRTKRSFLLAANRTFNSLARPLFRTCGHWIFLREPLLFRAAIESFQNQICHEPLPVTRGLRCSENGFRCRGQFLEVRAPREKSQLLSATTRLPRLAPVARSNL